LEERKKDRKRKRRGKEEERNMKGGKESRKGSVCFLAGATFWTNGYC
jgi:hypothetical protein